MNSRYADSDVMAAIKAATCMQHESLEKRAGILQVTSTAQGYARIIAVLTSIHTVYEPQIGTYAEQFDGFGFAIARRSKLALLAADRRAIRERLGIDVGDIVPDLGCTIDTFAQAVGWLYVLEGSTLGGNIIAAHVGRALDIPTSYYGAYGAQSARMWREFGAFVAAFVASEAGVMPAIIAGAQQAFGHIGRALMNQASSA